jgi:hypothetical protein
VAACYAAHHIDAIGTANDQRGGHTLSGDRLAEARVCYCPSVFSPPNKPPKSVCDVGLPAGSVGPGGGTSALLGVVFLFALVLLAVFFIPFFLRAEATRLTVLDLLDFFAFAFLRFFAMMALR